MAGYECSLCGGAEQATLLVTPLTGGETMAIGPDCMGVAFAGMLAGHLGIDPEALYKAADRLAKAEAKRAAKAVPGSEDASTDGKGVALVWVPAGPKAAEAGGD